VDKALRINGHSHLLPYPEQIPSFMKEKEIFWIDDDRKYMRQKGWQRPITASSFFLDEKLAWMDDNNIDHAVVLNLSQLYGNGLTQDEVKVALGFQNNFNAQVQEEHPTRFSCGFVVHAGFVQGALWEIERCVEKLGLQLLCLPTHYMDSAGKWRGIVGYFEKFPNLRVCFAHGGQLNQINHGRRVQGFDGRPDLFEGKIAPKMAVGHPNIFFDTLVHDTLTFELMIKRQRGTDQIIMGLDDPYPLGEMESERQSSYPGKLLDLAEEQNLINSEQHRQIWCDNVLRWLCSPDKTDRFYNRINSTKTA